MRIGIPAKVVDASALAALVFGEPEAKELAGKLKAAELLAPSLLPFELASIARKKIVKQPKDRHLVIRALALGLAVEMKYVDVDQEQVVELALETGLTVYDSCYLWVARQFKVPLVTLDRALAAAAARQS